jgi:hypothetical protein
VLMFFCFHIHNGWAPAPWLGAVGNMLAGPGAHRSSRGIGGGGAPTSVASGRQQAAQHGMSN